MSDISAASKLEFFKAERYKYDRYNTFDTSSCPRPHFCMGLVLKGHGNYTDCDTGEVISVERGDIIFVPKGSRYISEWKGEPEISYLSMHFIFDHRGFFSERQNFVLQKVNLGDFAAAEKEFEYAVENYDGESYARLAVLGAFYRILSEILPKLRVKKGNHIDDDMEKVIDYIEAHPCEKISANELARLANMSVSRFFTIFKKNFGMTPVEYINHYKIDRALIIMMRDEKMTVEEISEAAGFESSAYFRRTFKKITGISPREYKKRSMEM